MDNNELTELKEVLNAVANSNSVKQDLATIEAIKSWKATKSPFLDFKQFETPRELIKCILATTHYSGLVIYGEGGLGKTMMALHEIKAKLADDQWEYSNGYTTPLSLYEFLYNNREKPILILDDIEGLFTNNIAISILKGALWETDGKRIVQYMTKSDKTDVPSQFILNSKLVILCNKLPNQKEASMRALISRTITYEMNLSFQEKMQISENIILNSDLSADNQQLAIKLLRENVNLATEDFNLRTLRKLMAYVHYDANKAGDLFKETTKIDEAKNAYLTAISQSNVPNAQYEIFHSLTGLSKRTFFRVKKQCQSDTKR